MNITVKEMCELSEMRAAAEDAREDYEKHQNETYQKRMERASATYRAAFRQAHKKYQMVV